MSISEAKSKMRQMLAGWYPADLEKSPAAPLEGMESINVLAGDLEDDPDWDVVGLTGVATYLLEPVSMATIVVDMTRAWRLVALFVCLLTYCRW